MHSIDSNRQSADFRGAFGQSPRVATLKTYCNARTVRKLGLAVECSRDFRHYAFSDLFDTEGPAREGRLSAGGAMITAATSARGRPPGSVPGMIEIGNTEVVLCLVRATNG